MNALMITAGIEWVIAAVGLTVIAYGLTYAAALRWSDRSSPSDEE